jgi:sulfur carrier protein
LESSRSTLELHPRASIDGTESIEYFEVIALIINGQPRSFPAPLSVTDLIEQLELRGKRIALERNGEIVPRSKFGALELNDGDALEIVVAVGGG